MSQSIKHEILESIYFRDPNGYPLEITRSLRDMETLDAVDAELTIAAALGLEAGARWNGIESLWRAKAALVRQHQHDVAEADA